MSDQHSLAEAPISSPSPEFLYDGRIVVYRITMMDRKTVDEHFAQVREIITNWPSDRPYLALHDYAAGNFMTMTPYVREKKEEMAEVRPDLKGFQAMVLPSASMAFFGNLAMRMVNKSKRVPQMFSNRQAALDWLVSKLDE